VYKALDGCDKQGGGGGGGSGGGVQVQVSKQSGNAAKGPAFPGELRRSGPSARVGYVMD
jgi:hypothetical protein